MIKKIIYLLLVLCSTECLNAQQFYEQTPDAKHWVKKQFRKLNKSERIAQLMIIRAHSNLGPEHIAEVTNLIPSSVCLSFVLLIEVSVNPTPC